MPGTPILRPRPGDADPGLYQAADPGYTANFSRDSLTYALLANDHRALRAQLDYSALHQGRRRDPETGEEPGKIHHELPGVQMRGLWTTYNACDTAALFLMAIRRLAERREGIAETFREHIERAVVYLREHVYDDIFYDDTRQSGADRFALKVTYWKDSELNVSGARREPSYPIAYALAHFQAKAGLEAAAELLHAAELRALAAAMTRRGFETFWSEDHFRVAAQADGTVIDPPSSDSLHALLFLRRGEIPPDDAQAVVTYSERLATPVGYLPGLAQTEGGDEYHTRWVWVHEQALLHAAARRHQLERAMRVTERIVPTFTQGFPELIDPVTRQPGGNPTQLWSIGAHVYFEQLRVANALSRLVDRIDLADKETAA